MSCDPLRFCLLLDTRAIERRTERMMGAMDNSKPTESISAARSFSVSLHRWHAFSLGAPYLSCENFSSSDPSNRTGVLHMFRCFFAFFSFCSPYFAGLRPWGWGPPPGATALCPPLPFPRTPLETLRALIPQRTMRSILFDTTHIPARQTLRTPPYLTTV